LASEPPILLGPCLAPADPQPLPDPAQIRRARIVAYLHPQGMSRTVVFAEFRVVEKTLPELVGAFTLEVDPERRGEVVVTGADGVVTTFTVQYLTS